MSSQKSKVGFKIFSRSLLHDKLEIPFDWDIKNLDEICEVKAGESAPQEMSDFSKDGIPFVRVSDMSNSKNKKFLHETRDKIDENVGKGLGLKKYQKNSIILPKSGVSTLLNYRLILGVDSFVVSHIAVLITSKVDTGFLYYVLQKWDASLLVISTSLPALPLSQLKKVQIQIPPINEQEKIASILSNVDNLVSSYDSIIESTKRLKTGLMQKLLIKGIDHKKFKKVKWLFGKEIEIPNNWISKKVEDVFKLKSGSTPSRTKPEFFEGDISWVTSTDLNRSKITSTIEKITKDAVKDANLTILPKGTFLIATYGLEAAGTRGKCGILEMDATCNQACMAFLPYSGMTSVFVFYFYLYFGEKIVFSIAQGTKQQNLYSDTVKKVTLLVPPLEEQEKIISILSEIDSKITDLESKKTTLGKVKKGLMQKLLTGQIRVKV